MTTNHKPGPFAYQINALIDRLALTDDQACAYIGVPLFTLRKWRTGERTPGAVAQRLIDVLGVIEVMSPDIHASLLNAPKKPCGD